MSEWVSVKDRLPADGLVNPNTGDYQLYQCALDFGAGVRDIRTLAYVDGRWTLHAVDYTQYVLYWRPLPELPKEMSEETQIFGDYIAFFDEPTMQEVAEAIELLAMELVPVIKAADKVSEVHVIIHGSGECGSQDAICARQGPKHTVGLKIVTTKKED